MSTPPYSPATFIRNVESQGSVFYLHSTSSPRGIVRSEETFPVGLVSQLKIWSGYTSPNGRSFSGRTIVLKKLVLFISILDGSAGTFTAFVI